MIPQTVNRALDGQLFERRFFRVAAILFALIVLAGFGRTYYLKGLFAMPPLASMLVHTHGALMTAWVALFAVQAWFISSKRIALHQRLGHAGIGLGALMSSSGSSPHCAPLDMDRPRRRRMSRRSRS